MTVRVEFKRGKAYNGASNIHAMTGSKVFLDDGTEITDIVSIGMPDGKANSLVCVTLTIPVSDIKFVD